MAQVTKEVLKWLHEFSSVTLAKRWQSPAQPPEETGSYSNSMEVIKYIFSLLSV